MLKICIFILLCLLIYQFVPMFVEGLDGDSSSDSGTGSSAPTGIVLGTGPCTGCTLSLTDQNISYLNNQVNSLQTQYTDLSGNITTINQQLQELMQQNTDAATGMVGDQPLNIGDDSTNGTGTGTSFSLGTST